MHAGGRGSGEIVLTPQLGTDGGFVFGRVGTEGATVVEIELPEIGSRMTAEVGPSRFFLAPFPPDVMRRLTANGVFDLARLAGLTAIARDANGAEVARFVVASGESLLPLGTPTDTSGPVSEPG